MGWLHVGMRGMSSPSLPYRHMLVDSNDSERLGLLLQLAMTGGSGLLQDVLNSTDLSSVDFFHLSCSGFTQDGASRLILPSDVEVEKTVITNPDHDLSPPANARIGKRFVCLLDADLRTEIQGIEEFVADLNQFYARLKSEETEALILFSDQEPPATDNANNTFEMKMRNKAQGLWNDPVWGYVRIFSDKPPSEAPLHDDKERSLVITDFSAHIVPEVNGVFAYQNYVIRNLERRLFTGLSHFISQYQSLKRSLVATSKRFTDARTEQNSPISLLHSVAYDPLILHPTQTVSMIDSASLYCNVDKSRKLWPSQQIKKWNGTDEFRSLWDLSSGLYENPHITQLCMSFVSFLREPTVHTYGEFVSSLNEYNRTVLDESAEIYGESEDIHNLGKKIESIITEQFQGGKVPHYHQTNRKYSKNLSDLVAFVDGEVDADKDEFEQRINNPNLVALMLRAKFSDQLHEKILRLFTDEPLRPRSIKTYHLLGGVHNG